MDKIYCPGFKASGISAGIKKKTGALDLGLIVSETPAAVAGLFTQNQVKAAPVLLDQQRIQSGVCRAVVVNSGNANCCTGDKGLENARHTTKWVADTLGLREEQVLVSSTGVIGEPLPIEKIEKALPHLVETLAGNGFDDFSKAIMTTDTVPKLVHKSCTLRGKTFSIVGVAKGVGMIHPNMATMLSYICTDVEIEPGLLYGVLKSASDKSFNRITVDGDTSTNDTVLLLANGVSGVKITQSDEVAIFQKYIDEITLDLARRLVKDGEGATKLVNISVEGAMSDEDALKVAYAVAGSNLVKTAFFGEDANWGRIIGAIGRAGCPMNPEKIDIRFNDVMMVKQGLGCGKEVEAKATAVLKQPEFDLVIHLHVGTGQATVLTCDFSLDYVKINADYRS